VSVEGALGEAAHRALERVLSLLAQERASVSSVTAPRQAWEVHVADSLSGLELAELRDAERIADIGAGAGFPGIALAVALPNAEVDLIESVRRKCDFLGRAIDAAGIANATVVCRRSEDWAAEAGREAYDAVTARAVGSLPTLAELASPLLVEGGMLVAWKGARSEAEEAELAKAGGELAMEQVEVRAVKPFAGSRDRHIHLVRKNGPTPNGLPRRPGMAAKRPFGSESKV
jgi:16S rRNA (guanine527-N7)-methyltransferase